MSFQKPKGTQDLLPGTVEKWQFIEQTARELCHRFGYREIRTPIFEQTELFARGVGETTDVVEKEMYTFEDKGKRSMTLRPEGTAGVVRAFVENKLYAEPDLSKLYYIGPMFRYEQPQAGRYRQLHQFGVEAFGSNDPALDAEVIALGYMFYTELGIEGVRVELNSVGNLESRLATDKSCNNFCNLSLTNCVATASRGLNAIRFVFWIARSIKTILTMCRRFSTAWTRKVRRISPVCRPNWTR